jgi:hypothetical protein
MLRQVEHTKNQGPDRVLTLHGRITNVAKIARYSKRNQLVRRPGTREIVDQIAELSVIPRRIESPETIQIEEKFLHNIQLYIKGSFELGLWRFVDNEHLIESSTVQPKDQHSIYSFYSGVRSGCERLNAGEGKIGGIHLGDAFKSIDELVLSTYHDVLPNIIWQLTDLYNGGPEQRKLAEMIRQHITEAAQTYPLPDDPRRPIFKAFKSLDLSHMKDLEDKMMDCFVDNFRFFLGARCYSTFVMESNRARRRLDWANYLTLDECLPDLHVLDQVFGPSNLRPLEVIRRRTEVSFKRGLYAQTKTESNRLVERALLVCPENEAWTRQYFLLKGLQYLGDSQFCLRESAGATAAYEEFIRQEAVFSNLTPGFQFRPAKFRILERLEELAVENHETGRVAAWRRQREEMIDLLEAEKAFLNL